MKQRPLVRLVVLLAIGVWCSATSGQIRTDELVVQKASSRFGAVDRLLANHVERRQIAGAVAVVIHKGEVVYSTAVGVRDREAETAMTKDTIFRIASMTKPITSVAAMMLRDEGRLRLGDAVSKYLPEFAQPQVLEIDERGGNRTVPARRDITIRDLLTHTSGLTYSFLGPQPIRKRYSEAGVTDGLVETPRTLAENVRRLAKAPLVHQPGEAWQYGLSTDVLGRLVEVVSGKTLDEFFRERIFVPLRMKDTHFVLPNEKVSRLAALYRPTEDRRIKRVGKGAQREGGLRYSATYPYPGHGEFYSGGAGLVSTAADYTRFLQMLLGRGELNGVRLLKAETVAEMTRNQIGGLNIAFTIHGDKFGFGFGVHTEQSEDRHGASVGTYSWGGIFNTYFWVDPREEVIGVLMTQLYPFGHLSLWADFQERIYTALHDDSGQHSRRSPQPGDIDRDDALHNRVAIDRRTTDPQVSTRDARKNLPHPVLRRVEIRELRAENGGPRSGSQLSRLNAQRDDAAYERHALTHEGDPKRGRQLFLDGERTKCSVCHKVEGRGGEAGPDLTHIGGKFDRPHLIESLLEPSRQIVEGFRMTTVLTGGGRVRSGILTEQNQKQVTLVDADGKERTIRRDEIEELSESSVSIMPDDLVKTLSLREFTDLIAYLESLRPAGNKMGAGIVGPISLPEGFDVRTVATGLSGATALELLPDGRVLLCEQTGAVRVVENGKLLEEPFVTLPVEAYWERGVIGVTCHPEFPQPPYVYVCWIAKDPYPHHRVSRFTAEGNVAVPGSETLLLIGDDQRSMGGNIPAGHQGGALHFGTDGKLYIAIGEQTAGRPAQKLDTFLGKLLRINPDGSIPKDNPFVAQAKGKYRAIWARGCRNPFTFAIRRSDGLMLINDVGGQFEEINVGRAGANYGWPVFEHGDRKEYEQDPFQGPIHWYPQSSINGGDFCRHGSNWPEIWQGRYFFADFVQGWIKALDPDHPKDVKTFGSGFRRPVDLRFASDGSLYLLLRNAWVIDDKFEPGTGSLLQVER